MTARNPVTTSKETSELPHPIYQLLQEDTRYKLEAYDFVRRALAYAQDELMMEGEKPEVENDTEGQGDVHYDESGGKERHLTGQ